MSLWKKAWPFVWTKLDPCTRGACHFWLYIGCSGVEDFEICHYIFIILLFAKLSSNWTCVWKRNFKKCWYLLTKLLLAPLREEGAYSFAWTWIPVIQEYITPLNLVEIGQLTIWKVYAQHMPTLQLVKTNGNRSPECLRWLINGYTSMIMVCCAR